MIKDIVIVAILLVVLIALFVVWRQGIKQEATMKNLVNSNELNTNRELNSLKSEVFNELLLFQSQVTTSLRSDFNVLNENTNTRLGKIQESVNSGINMSFAKTNESFINMAQELVKINETQKNLNLLSQDLVGLQNLLSNKQTRGVYGEIELYSILENVFGNNNQLYQRQYQLSSGVIADAVIFSTNDERMIAVDSKFPLDNYNRSHDPSLSKVEQNKAANEFRKDVSRHIQTISSKYLIEGETADIAYMFIPAEAIFAEIYGQYPELISLSYDLRVYLVSPTTLMAYITATKAIHLTNQRDANVVLIQQEYYKLSQEFERYVTRYQALLNDFKRMNASFDNMRITNDKIISRFNQINQMKFDDQKGTIDGED